MIRRLARFLLVLLLPPVVLAGAAVGWLAVSESGLAWVWARLVAATEGRLDGQVSGRLIGPIRADRVSYRDGGTVLTVESAGFDWRPGALLMGRVLVDRLEAAGVELTLPAGGEPPDTPPQLPDLRLPFDVELRAARLSRLRVGEPGSEPVQVDDARMAGRLDGDGIHLARFEVAGPWGEARLSGHSGLTAESRVELTGAFQARLPGAEGPLEGKAGAAGPLGRPRVTLDLDGPLRGRLTGEIGWLGQTLQWRLQAQLTAPRLAALAQALPPVGLDARFTSEGEPERFTLEGEGELDSAGQGRWRAHFGGGRRAAEWRIDRLQLAALDGPARADATGRYTEGGELRARIEWQSLQWPPTGEAELGSARGHLAASGPIGAVALNGDAVWQASTLPPGDLQLSGTLGEQRLDLHQAAADWLDGRWVGGGRIAWSAVPEWQAQLQATGIDPGRIDPAWPGQLGAKLKASGRLGAAPQLQAELVRLEGQLRGQPVAGQGAVGLSDGQMTITGLELRSGLNRAALAGEIGRRWGLEWLVEAPRLDQFLPDAGGTLRGEGRVSGGREAPRVEARIEGRSLRFGERAVSMLKLDADLAPDGQWRLDGQADRLALGEASFSRVTLGSRGDAKRHRLRLEGEGPGSDVELTAEGGLTAGEWRGELKEGRLELPGLGRWTQAEPAALAVGPRRAELKPWCWRQENARLCLDAARDAGRLRAAVELSALPLALLTAATPGIEAEGTLTGTAQVLFEGERVQVLEATLAAANGSVRYRAEDGEPVTSRFREVSLDLGQAQGDLVASLQLRAESGGQLSAQARVGGWQAGALAQRPIRGTVTLQVPHLAWVAPLAPQIADPRGRISGSFQLGGRVGAPAIDGSLQLADGAVALPDAGLVLTGAELRVASAPGGALAITGQVRSGEGVLRLDGRLVLPGAAPWRLDLTAAGERLLAVNLPSARLIASPDLKLMAAPGSIELTGRVVIPEGEIHLPDIPRSTGVSDDVVVVDRPRKEPFTGPGRLRVEVRLVLGDKVRIDGYGIDGRLTGAVTLIEEPGGVPRGEGELKLVDGRYKAYGQTLELTQGRLLFAGGPVTEAGLSARAVRKFEEERVEVGVEVSGTARRPQARLFSDPAMDQSDILSWLVLGYPLNRAEKEQAAGLSQAAASLGLAGGEQLAKQIAGRFGIDQVEVARGVEPGETALLLGKYLTPRLYVQYLIGFAQTANAWRLRYRWTEHWSLEAQTGPKGGADILFTIER